MNDPFFMMKLKTLFFRTTAATLCFTFTLTSTIAHGDVAMVAQSLSKNPFCLSAGLSVDNPRTLSSFPSAVEGSMRIATSRPLQQAEPSIRSNSELRTILADGDFSYLDGISTTSIAFSVSGIIGLITAAFLKWKRSVDELGVEVSDVTLEKNFGSEHSSSSILADIAIAAAKTIQSDAAHILNEIKDETKEHIRITKNFRINKLPGIFRISLYRAQTPSQWTVSIFQQNQSKAPGAQASWRSVADAAVYIAFLDSVSLPAQEPALPDTAVTNSKSGLSNPDEDRALENRAELRHETLSQESLDEDQDAYYRRVAKRTIVFLVLAAIAGAGAGVYFFSDHDERPAVATSQSSRSELRLNILEGVAASVIGAWLLTNLMGMVLGVAALVSAMIQDRRLLRSNIIFKPSNGQPADDQRTITIETDAERGAIILNNKVIPANPIHPDFIENIIEGVNSILGLKPNQFIAVPRYSPDGQRVLGIDFLADSRYTEIEDFEGKPERYELILQSAVFHYGLHDQIRIVNKPGRFQESNYKLIIGEHELPVTDPATLSEQLNRSLGAYLGQPDLRDFYAVPINSSKGMRIFFNGQVFSFDLKPLKTVSDVRRAIETLSFNLRAALYSAKFRVESFDSRSELRQLSAESITRALVKNVDQDEFDIFGGSRFDEIAFKITETELKVEDMDRAALENELKDRLFKNANIQAGNLDKAATIVRQALVAERLIPESFGDYLRFEKVEDGVFQITMTNYKNRNALDLNRVLEERRMMERILHIGIARKARGLKTAWVKASEGANYAAGADLTVFNELKDQDPEQITQYALQYSVPNWRFKKKLQEKYDIVSIAAISRPALGGGAEDVLENTVRVMDRVRGGIAQPESKLGLLAGAGGIVYLPRLAGPARALIILLSGGMVSPRVAQKIGWVDVLANEGEALSTSIDLARDYVQSQLPVRAWLRESRKLPMATAPKALSDWQALRYQVIGAFGQVKEEFGLVKELYQKIRALLIRGILDIKSPTEQADLTRSVLSDAEKQELIQWAKGATQSAELKELLINLIETAFAMALPRTATSYDRKTKTVTKREVTRVQTLEATFRTVIESLENPDADKALANVMHVFGHELVARGKGEGASGIAEFNEGFRVPDARPDLLEKLASPEILKPEAGVKYWLWLAGIGNSAEQERARTQLAKFGARQAERILAQLRVNNSEAVPSLDPKEVLAAFVVRTQPDGGEIYVPRVNGKPIDDGVRVQVLGSADNLTISKNTVPVKLEFVQPIDPANDVSPDGVAYSRPNKGANAKDLKAYGPSFRYVAVETSTSIDQAIEEIKATGVEFMVVLADKEGRSTPLLNEHDSRKIQFIYFPRLDATLGIYEYLRSELRSENYLESDQVLEISGLSLTAYEVRARNISVQKLEEAVARNAKQIEEVLQDQNQKATARFEVEGGYTAAVTWQPGPYQGDKPFVRLNLKMANAGNLQSVQAQLKVTSNILNQSKDEQTSTSLASQPTQSSAQTKEDGVIRVLTGKIPGWMRREVESRIQNIWKSNGFELAENFEITTTYEQSGKSHYHIKIERDFHDRSGDVFEIKISPRLGQRGRIHTVRVRVDSSKQIRTSVSPRAVYQFPTLPERREEKVRETPLKVDSAILLEKVNNNVRPGYAEIEEGIWVKVDQIIPLLDLMEDLAERIESKMEALHATFDGFKNTLDTKIFTSPMHVLGGHTVFSLHSFSGGWKKLIREFRQHLNNGTLTAKEFYWFVKYVKEMTERKVAEINKTFHHPEQFYANELTALDQKLDFSAIVKIKDYEQAIEIQDLPYLHGYGQLVAALHISGNQIGFTVPDPRVIRVQAPASGKPLNLLKEGFVHGGLGGQKIESIYELRDGDAWDLKGNYGAEPQVGFKGYDVDIQIRRLPNEEGQKVFQIKSKQPVSVHLDRKKTKPGMAPDSRDLRRLDPPFHHYRSELRQAEPSAAPIPSNITFTVDGRENTYNQRIGIKRLSSVIFDILNIAQQKMNTSHLSDSWSNLRVAAISINGQSVTTGNDWLKTTVDRLNLQDALRGVSVALADQVKVVIETRRAELHRAELRGTASASLATLAKSELRSILGSLALAGTIAAFIIITILHQKYEIVLRRPDNSIRERIFVQLLEKLRENRIGEHLDGDSEKRLRRAARLIADNTADPDAVQTKIETLVTYITNSIQQDLPINEEHVAVLLGIKSSRFNSVFRSLRDDLISNQREVADAARLLASFFRVQISDLTRFGFSEKVALELIREAGFKEEVKDDEPTGYFVRSELRIGEAINSDRAPEPVGAYPHARRYKNELFLSGVGPRQRGSKEIPGVTLDEQGRVTDHDIEAQMESTFQNVRWVLEAAGSSWEDISELEVFLTDMDHDYEAFARVWNKHFPSAKNQPRYTLIRVKALPTPIAFEVNAVARVKSAEMAQTVTLASIGPEGAEGKSIEEQVRATFDQARARLTAEGSSWEHILAIRVSLASMKDDFPVYNPLWLSTFPDTNGRPARTTVEVGNLPPGVRIQVKVTAAVEKPRSELPSARAELRTALDSRPVGAMSELRARREPPVIKLEVDQKIERFQERLSHIQKLLPRIQHYYPEDYRSILWIVRELQTELKIRDFVHQKFSYLLSHRDQLIEEFGDLYKNSFQNPNTSRRFNGQEQNFAHGAARLIKSDLLSIMDRLRLHIIRSELRREVKPESEALLNLILQTVASYTAFKSARSARYRKAEDETAALKRYTMLRNLVSALLSEYQKSENKTVLQEIQKPLSGFTAKGAAKFVLEDIQKHIGAILKGTQKDWYLPRWQVIDGMLHGIGSDMTAHHVSTELHKALPGIMESFLTSGAESVVRAPFPSGFNFEPTHDTYSISRTADPNLLAFEGFGIFTDNRDKKFVDETILLFNEESSLIRSADGAVEIPFDELAVITDLIEFPILESHGFTGWGPRLKESEQAKIKNLKKALEVIVKLLGEERRYSISISEKYGNFSVLTITISVEDRPGLNFLNIRDSIEGRTAAEIAKGLREKLKIDINLVNGNALQFPMLAGLDRVALENSDQFLKAVTALEILRSELRYSEDSKIEKTPNIVFTVNGEKRSYNQNVRIPYLSSVVKDILNTVRQTSRIPPETHRPWVDFHVTAILVNGENILAEPYWLGVPNAVLRLTAEFKGKYVKSTDQVEVQIETRRSELRTTEAVQTASTPTPYQSFLARDPRFKTRHHKSDGSLTPERLNGLISSILPTALSEELYLDAATADHSPGSSEYIRLALKEAEALQAVLKNQQDERYETVVKFLRRQLRPTERLDSILHRMIEVLHEKHIPSLGGDLALLSSPRPAQRLTTGPSATPRAELRMNVEEAISSQQAANGYLFYGARDRNKPALAAVLKSADLENNAWAIMRRNESGEMSYSILLSHEKASNAPRPVIDQPVILSWTSAAFNEAQAVLPNDVGSSKNQVSDTKEDGTGVRELIIQDPGLGRIGLVVSEHVEGVYGKVVAFRFYPNLTRSTERVIIRKIPHQITRIIREKTFAAGHVLNDRVTLPRQLLGVIFPKRSELRTIEPVQLSSELKVNQAKNKSIFLGVAATSLLILLTQYLTKNEFLSGVIGISAAALSSWIIYRIKSKLTILVQDVEMSKPFERELRSSLVRPEIYLPEFNDAILQYVRSQSSAIRYALQHNQKPDLDPQLIRVGDLDEIFEVKASGSADNLYINIYAPHDQYESSFVSARVAISQGKPGLSVSSGESSLEDDEIITPIPFFTSSPWTQILELISIFFPESSTSSRLQLPRQKSKTVEEKREEQEAKLINGVVEKILEKSRLNAGKPFDVYVTGAELTSYVQVAERIFNRLQAKIGSENVNLLGRTGHYGNHSHFPYVEKAVNIRAILPEAAVFQGKNKKDFKVYVSYGFKYTLDYMTDDYKEFLQGLSEVLKDSLMRTFAEKPALSPTILSLEEFAWVIYIPAGLFKITAHLTGRFLLNSYKLIRDVVFSDDQIREFKPDSVIKTVTVPSSDSLVDADIEDRSELRAGIDPTRAHLEERMRHAQDRLDAYENQRNIIDPKKLVEDRLALKKAQEALAEHDNQQAEQDKQDENETLPTYEDVIEGRSELRRTSGTQKEAVTLSDLVIHRELLRRDVPNQESDITSAIQAFARDNKAQLLKLKKGELTQGRVLEQPIIFEGQGEETDPVTFERSVVINFKILATTRPEAEGLARLSQGTEADIQLFNDLSSDITPESREAIRTAIQEAYKASNHSDNVQSKRSTTEAMVFTENIFFGHKGNLALIGEKLSAVYGRYFVIVTNNAQLEVIHAINQTIKDPRQHIVPVESYPEAIRVIEDHYRLKAHFVGTEQDSLILGKLNGSVWTQSVIAGLLSGLEPILINHFQAAMRLAYSA